MGMEGAQDRRIEDTDKAREMAEWSDTAHTEGDKRGASAAEIQAGVIYDTKKEIEGLSMDELKAKYKEASEIEEDYLKKYDNVNGDVAYMQLAQRRAVIEKLLVISRKPHRGPLNPRNL